MLFRSSISFVVPKLAHDWRLAPALFTTVFVATNIGAALGFRSTPIDPCSGVALLVENDVGGHAALLLDGIQGQRQVVIKSLESNYQQVEGIAAATILGDGRVALILDVDAVIANRRREPAPHADLNPPLLATAS